MQEAILRLKNMITRYKKLRERSNSPEHQDFLTYTIEDLGVILSELEKEL